MWNLEKIIFNFITGMRYLYKFLVERQLLLQKKFMYYLFALLWDYETLIKG
jgi:hypothetical protein